MINFADKIVNVNTSLTFSHCDGKVSNSLLLGMKGISFPIH